MSITVRQWSAEDLQAIKSGKDKWLATIFMNAETFDKKAIEAYPYHLRKTYVATFYSDDGPCEVKFYATDDYMAQKFLEAEYTKLPDSLCRIETAYIPIVEWWRQ